jgi:pyridinium-3,5-bisthiocarboxylic acid mononucleotide nickel chelatase
VLGFQAPPAAPSRVVGLAATSDNANPEITGALFETLRAAGALEVWLVPVIMKKGRAAVVLTALAEPSMAGPVEDAILRETTTLGVRRHAAARSVLPREIVTVETLLGTVRVKVARRPGGATASPEHDDCVAVAKAKGVPLREVYRLASVAAAEMLKARE